MIDIDFEKIWVKIILPEIEYYKVNNYGLKINYESKTLILSRYNELKDLCKSHFMSNAKKFIDRHKVCACLIYAIVDSHVVSCNNELMNENGEKEFSIVNEYIAITAGLSLLRAFVISAAKVKYENHEISKVELDKIIFCFDNGIFTPEGLTNHGDYLENFAIELHFSKEYNNNNILSLAHILYLLELLTQIKGGYINLSE